MAALGNHPQNMIHFLMVKNQSRRNFIQAAPLAAASLSFTEKALFAQTGSPANAQIVVTPPVHITADKLATAVQQLQAAPGNDNLYTPASLPFTVVLTTEVRKSAKEFEWHEGRDHILQVLDGSTVYELGGTPQNGRNTKPGEWLAPASQNATTLTLRKGDMLIIPRGTPHRRSTADSITFYLISTTGK
jgi:mannose-6-phosphate isomerase-like protein (cupin superfamily)